VQSADLKAFAMQDMDAFSCGCLEFRVAFGIARHHHHRSGDPVQQGHGFGQVAPRVAEIPGSDDKIRLIRRLDKFSGA
jgi:hypothetical protein